MAHPEDWASEIRGADRVNDRLEDSIAQDNFLADWRYWLRTAVVQGDADEFNLALCQFPGMSELERRTAHGETLLHKAVQAGQAAMVERLIRLGVTTGVRDANGRDALDVAVNGGRAECLAVLLDRHPDTSSIPPQIQAKLLKAAVLSRHQSCLRLLLDVGFVADAQDESGETALMQSLSLRTPDMALPLLAQGANPDLEDNRGFSAYDRFAQNHVLKDHQVLRAALQKCRLGNGLPKFMPENENFDGLTL